MTLLWLSGAFVVGVWLGVQPGGGWDPPGFVLHFWAIAILLVVGHQRITKRPAFLAVVVLFLVLGLVRTGTPGTNDDQGELPVSLLAERVEFEGVLKTEPRSYGGVTRLPLRANRVVDSDGEHISLSDPIKIDVLADQLFGAVEPLRGFRYGDTYRVSGRFQSRSDAAEFPPGITPDAAGVVTSSSVRLLDSSAGSDLRREIADLRGGVSASISKTIPGDASGLATAVTTGDRTGLSPSLRDDFQEAGLSHLLAISGLHVAIVAGLVLAVAARLFGRQRQLYLLMPFLAVVVYALMAGLSPSVTRAALMASVYLLAIALGRQRSVVPAIALAGAAMALIQPESVGTLSFQLSFAAVLGIATLEPRMRGGMEVVVGRMAPEGHIAHGPLVAITRGLGYSLAATVATLPLVGSTFEEVPILGAIATLLALPAVPLLIVTSGLVAAIEPVWSFGASPIGWLAWLCAQWIVLVARLFAAVPGGTISTQGWSGWLAALWYGALFAWLGRDTLRRVATAAPGIMRTRAAEFASSQRFPGRRSLSWFGLPALMLAVLPWIAVAQSSGDRLSVTFFETDRGDMILVETSGGRQALIDGGRDVDGAAQALGETLPFWDRRIDVMVLTHSDADHVGGLVEVLGRYEVGAVVDTTGIAETDVFVEWRDRIGVLGAQVVEARTGMVVQLDDDVSLEVIWAGSSEFSETNAASTVLMLRHGEMRMLLTGDIPRSVESRLLGAVIPLAADVLKAPHHGSDTSSSGPFIDAVHPTVVVIPVGERNPFGHPDEDVLQRYADGVPDASVLITKDRGDVVVETDGERLWVTTDR